MEPFMDVMEITLCFLVLLHRTASVYSEGDDQAPTFDVPVVNVTATAGTTAILPCTINYVGDHAVVWMAPRDKVLTLSDRRIIHDQRISIERPYTKDWNLHIRKVNLSDSGEYKCQINTNPVKSKMIILVINEAPQILEDSGDQSVREGDTVILWCKVTGIPYPQVKWYRRSIKDGEIAKEVIGADQGGEELMIHNVSRYCEDVYECEAFNGIEPTASRQMKVIVTFPPEVELYSNRMSQTTGRETILDCRVTANPHGYEVWRKGSQEITSSWKYGVQVYTEDLYTKTLSLRIGSISEEDFGKYKCFAKNPYGSDEEDMILFEYVDKKHKPTTTTRRPRPTMLIDTKPLNRNRPGFYQDPHNGRSRGRHPTPALPTARYLPGNPDTVRGAGSRVIVNINLLVIVLSTTVFRITSARR